VKRRAGLGALAGRAVAAGQSDAGSATIWALAVGLVLVAAGVAGAAVGAARVGRHQAGAAADLGALAGAVDAVQGSAVACPRAAAVVSANGGRLVACTVDGLDLVVTAAVTVHTLPGLTAEATASARAGPLRAPALVADLDLDQSWGMECMDTATPGTTGPRSRRSAGQRP
jgi:secretion/DNA translocation related TadE-like protein